MFLPICYGFLDYKSSKYTDTFTLHQYFDLKLGLKKLQYKLSKTENHKRVANQNTKVKCE